MPQSKSPSATAAASKQQPRTGNLIDLDAPEFDEFNLSEEDMAMMAASIVDDRKPVQQAAPPPTVSPKAPTPSPRTRQPPQASPREPPKASPRTQQPPSVSSKPQPPQPSKPPGLIDLDAPEFAEFDMTDEELAALAASFVDDRAEPKEEPAKLKPPPPQAITQSLPAKVQPSSGDPPTKESVLAVLRERKEQYHTASMKAKQSSDTRGMKRYGRVAVQFDHVIKALNEEQPIDLSQMPPPPPGFKSKYNIDISKFAAPPPPAPPTTSVTQSVQQASAAEPEEDPPTNPEIPIPKTALEALQQRLEKYKQGQKNAQDAGESSRVRRTGRIVKQYEEAIKMVKAGKPIDLSELPCPPGYPPIPAGKPAASPRPSPQPRPVAQSLPASIPTPHKAMASVSDKQLQILQERMGELRQAAREAKAKNDKDTALRYLRYSKGVEQMLLAAKNGLPVDLTQVGLLCCSVFILCIGTCS